MLLYSWEQLWNYFRNAPNNIKLNIWNELDLMNFLPTVTKGAYDEIMKFAPPDIIQAINYYKQENNRRV